MNPSKRKPFALLAFAVALACLATVGFGSVAATGASKAGGGLGIPRIPAISDVICLTGCTKIREVSPGGSIQITGTDMDSVAWVAFRTDGRNVRARPDRVTGTRVEVTVPDAAVTGRIRVISTSNSPSAVSRQLLTIGARTLTRTGRLIVTDAVTAPTTAFQYGLRPPTLRFVVNGAARLVNLRIDIVNAGGDVVRSRFMNNVRTGAVQRIAWGGVINGGRQAPNGAYRFVIRANDGTAATISNQLRRKIRKASAASAFHFRMYRFVFPVRGPHTYGDGIGAPRGGHTHQGVDVMARCGTPMVAARAGTVYYNSYDAGGAGNYLVINTKGNRGHSHVYMHMPRRSPLKVGTEVKTGQRIGAVGTTGSSTACHLHFEIWTGPGWYQGGTFLNPMPHLRAWDRYS